jgi:hypothetical protein
MIGEALEVMLFGMLGIFMIMGLIIVTILLLSRQSGSVTKKADSD